MAGREQNTKLQAQVEKNIREAVVSTSFFGRSGDPFFEIDLNFISSAAPYLRGGEIRLDFLENLVATVDENSIVLTYFLKSFSDTKQRLVLRGKVPLTKDKVSTAPSVVPYWPMAACMEREIGDLFGVSFKGGSQPDSGGRAVLPKGWRGFPMRRDYEFPKKFGDLEHSRTADGVSS